jgi:tRNA A-37 threonylcarbamoyl transferase component Bud32
VSLSRGSLFAGDFTILDDRPLAEGGMGAVYVVEQVSTGKKRALKLMHPQLLADPKLRERFVLEARVGGKIESAHVVEVVSAGIDEPTRTPWLAMELLDGVDLDQRIVQHGPLAPPDALEIFEQLCHAVGAAHRVGIVHRDLKPENIYLARSKDSSGRSVVKVLDFGLAKIVAEAASQGTGAMGTPLWMAPEQTEPGMVGPTADVWALGLIAFFVLTGRSFWKSATQDEVSVHHVLREILIDPIPPASQRASELGAPRPLPPGFDAWLACCLARDPAARFATATLAFDALRSLLAPSSHAAAATAPTLFQAPSLAGVIAAPPPRARGPMLALLVALLLTFGGAMTYLLLAHRAAETRAAAVDASADAGPLATTPTASPTADDADPADTVPPLPLPTVSAPVAHAPAAPHGPKPAAPVLVGDGPGTPPPLPAPPPGAADAPPTGIGFISVTSLPPARVSIDGKLVGVSPILSHSVGAGAHQIFLNNKEEGLRRVLTVVVLAGETKAIRVDLRNPANAPRK